jgi:hypothetical protein
MPLYFWFQRNLWAPTSRMSFGLQTADMQPLLSMKPGLLLTADSLPGAELLSDPHPVYVLL